VERGHRYIRKAKKLLVPEIQRRKAMSSPLDSAGANNLLTWMMEIAGENEGEPQSLAHLEVVLSLASIHTSQMNAVHCLYDLIARPEYIKPIRDEITRVVEEDGGWKLWQKSSFTKLGILDSFMRESQRWNPPTLLSCIE